MVYIPLAAPYAYHCNMLNCKIHFTLPSLLLRIVRTTAAIKIELPFIELSLKAGFNSISLSIFTFAISDN